MKVDLVLKKPNIRVEVKYRKVWRRKGVDIILSKDELSISKKPIIVPTSLFC